MIKKPARKQPLKNEDVIATGKRKVDNEQVISDLKKIFHSQNGKNFDNEQSNVILRSLLSFRDTRKHLRSSPRHLFQVIAENSNFYDKMAYPCDIVDLRRFFENGEIYSDGKISFFSQSCTKKLFSDYSCMILLNCGPEELARKENHNLLLAGGLAVYDTDKISISEKISAVVIGYGANFDAVDNIISDTLPDCPIYGADHVPGLERLKIASKVNTFVVNLSPLHIKNWIAKAPTAEDAVNRALAKKWNKLPQSNTEKRPERYYAKFWINSGFWERIVRPLDRDKKVAQAQSEQPQVQLTPEEQEVFNTIMAVDRQFNLGQQYRVAGGWVRDKLLGTESDDIDIALDKMTGQEFKKYADQYAMSHPDSGIGKSYVVDQNPDASKHLETTAIQIGAYKVDFVNLRTEDYASDSRIPEMKFGTPEQDAERRDLTINSMFYNINTGQVEDYVGGMEDLKTLTLRTPLDGRQTFMDDPLRMLRVLRFNSRYDGATIAPETLQAMSLPEVHDAYRQKVSPERAGPEIMKLFSGAKPEESIRALYETGMDAALLNLPDFDNLKQFNMNQMNPNHQLNLMEHTLKVMSNMNEVLANNGIEGKDRSLALMATWFHDFGKMHPDIQKPRGYKDEVAPDPNTEGDMGTPGVPGDPEHMSYHGHEDESAKLSESFLKSIGIGSDDRKIVNMIVQEHMAPHSYDGGWNKRKMGKLRQKTTIPGNDRTDLWKFVMWHGQADAAAKSEESTLEDFPDYEQRFNDTDAYMNAPPPAKPLVDGRRLMQLFPTLKPQDGFISAINTRLLDEQGAGNITNVQEAEAFVESIRADIEGQFVNIQRGSMNWYSGIKIADASSGTGVEGYRDGTDSELTRHKDQVKMIYRNPGESSLYSLGDRVRRRQMGMINEPVTGKVVSKKGTKIKIKWDDSGSQELFDMHDTATMSNIERV